MSTTTIDAWIQRPTQWWLDMPTSTPCDAGRMVPSPRSSPRASWTLDRMDEVGVAMGCDLAIATSTPPLTRPSVLLRENAIRAFEFPS